MAAFVPAVINTYTGVRAMEPPIVEASSMLGARGARFVREVLVPAALPQIFTGLRLSLQASWTTLVAAELVGALYGLGQVLNNAAQDIYPAMILVGMVFVGLCGGLMTAALALVGAARNAVARRVMTRDFRTPLPRSEFLWLSAAGFAGFFGLWALVAASGLVPRRSCRRRGRCSSGSGELTNTPFVGFTIQQHLAS